jgi:endonuclease-3
VRGEQLAARRTSAKVRNLLKQLQQRYGKKPRPPSWGLVETLLFYLIYHSSSVSAARRAFKQFRDEYVDLNEVRVSSMNEIRATLKRAGANEQAAQVVRGVLKDIYLRENAVSLASIEELPADQAKRYLVQTEHLPTHAIDYLLLVRWEHPVLPVDEQIARMASRLGLASSKASVPQAQRSLMKLMRSDLFFDFFTLGLEHASKICREEPRCDRCALRKHCVYGKSASRKKKKKK